MVATDMTLTAFLTVIIKFSVGSRSEGTAEWNLCLEIRGKPGSWWCREDKNYFHLRCAPDDEEREVNEAQK